MPGRLARWAPPVIGLAVFLLVLGTAGLVVLDWSSRTAEMSALVSRIEVSEQAMARTNAAVSEAVAPYADRPTLSGSERAVLDAALSGIAATGLADVRSGGELVAAVRVLPWHREIIAAQQAYLAHNRAWQAYLDAARGDPQQFAQEHADISTTWEAAQPAVRGALPRPDLLGLGRRIAAIFAPPDSGAGQPA